jgi:hypothetical protein
MKHSTVVINTTEPDSEFCLCGQRAEKTWNGAAICRDCLNYVINEASLHYNEVWVDGERAA